MLLVILFAVLISTNLAKVSPNIIYNDCPVEEITHARKYGAEAYQNFLDATENSTSRERMDVYEEYFIACNDLGQDKAKEVFDVVAKTNTTDDIKLLLTLGFQSFVARFMSLPTEVLDKGMKELCSKYELQLQCQLGFGESRTQIFWRVEDLKRNDGNLRILLERQCPNPHADNSVYQCITKNVADYTKPCFTDMLNYNYTRYSAGRRIARLHINATEKVAQLTSNKNLDDVDQFLSLKQHVQSIFRSTLKSIAEIEGEKCEALSKVIKCVKPLVENKCGAEASYIFETSILVGYMRHQRREPLASQFEGFGVEADKKCASLNRFK